ncbi:spermidine synthase [Thecamonas trahens ATCC 50062]|uniref:thermospermine synthase n=1 Tax=Thecamonas trahens ATCC 50062 TaxID=461836 RepID=A0A0L0D8Y8_THETB|nr:spermidine synthase [Thecamonas trahens ATCC 50062]KNC47758.1 spermidine synthase [Thecamonas trahens ATCC 50062]|eukprot:XP_013759236.1 spermidine synthase [Thecamonas trahens ATCC 50062]
MYKSGLSFVEVYSELEHSVLALDAVVLSKTTAFQQLDIVDSSLYGRSLVLDGSWQSSSRDEAHYHEALVHPAFLAYAAAHGAAGPSTVLILGGGEGATAREALRWPSVTKVVMVDIDGEVVEACKEHMPEFSAGAFDDPKVELVIGDALKYLADAGADANGPRFDVVISDLSDPIDDGPSQALFTREVFASVRGVLSPEGVYVLQAGQVSPFLEMHVHTYSTMKAVYPHVLGYSTDVASFRSHWGFMLGAFSDAYAPQATCLGRPAPFSPLFAASAIDTLLAGADLTDSLQLLDGEGMLSMVTHPKWLRTAYARATKVFSSSDAELASYTTTLDDENEPAAAQ